MGMFRSVVSIVVLVVLSVFGVTGCGGSGSTPPVSVTATLLPVNAATGKVAGVAVTATFSAAITAPTTWTDVFTLKKDNAGENLCSSVTYDATTMIATCLHAPLTFGSSYTVALSGISGVTDPTPVSFGTSSFFGAVSTAGEMLSFSFDVTAGTVTIKSVSTGAVYATVNYIQDPADPKKYVIGGELTAYISGDLLTVPLDEGANAVLSFGVLVDPAKSDLNFMIGNDYGAQGLMMDNFSLMISYLEMNVGDDETGTMPFEYTTNIVAGPVLHLDYGLTAAGYLFNATDYYFSQAGSGAGADHDFFVYANEDGYSVMMVNMNDGPAQLFVINQDPSSGVIPVGISVGDVYNGYAYAFYDSNLHLTPYSLVVTSIDGTTIGVDAIAEGEPTYSYLLSHVTTPTELGSGFYKTADGLKVMRILGSNGIVLSDNIAADTYSFSLFIK